MYTIKQAALRSGVNAPLLRAWERRYGIVAPVRTDTGYRLYDEAAIDRLRAMRTLVDAGWSARQAAERISAADAAELAEINAAESAGRIDAAEQSDAVRAFVDGAVRIDVATIERALDDMFAGGSFERIVEERLYPALEALGDGWARGTVDVAGEHAASAAAVRRLGMAFEAAADAQADGSRPVLVGLPPGVRHEIPALAFAAAARRTGLPVLYLGPDVPAASWVAAVGRTDARGVALGVITEADIPAADEALSALRAAYPLLVVAVGGRHSDGVGTGDVVHLPMGLRESVATLSGALGRSSSVR